MSYNFTNGTSIIGNGVHTNNSSIYNLSIDMELITALLIIIMLCNIILVIINMIYLSRSLK